MQGMNIPYERPSDANPMRQSEWTRLERQRDFEDAFSAYQAPCGDDFLTELSLDSGLFDLLDGYSEAVEGCDENVNMSLDFEFELSFLSEFPLVPSAWDGSPSYVGGRSTYRSESGARSQNRRSRRLASRSDIYE
ncbi:putative 26.5 kDa heat shock protein, mitochondrial-like [Capsicum annuum]|nr:putative 26.5 kDa heat shock protein, mitochondrial-like [Capsicum annuum]KAF3654552.1 putative 26.5 kDa heat shock protein, mitochondrial-like [Capsicum annuum]